MDYAKIWNTHLDMQELIYQKWNDGKLKVIQKAREATPPETEEELDKYIKLLNGALKNFDFKDIEKNKF